MHSGSRHCFSDYHTLSHIGMSADHEGQFQGVELSEYSANLKKETEIDMNHIAGSEEVEGKEGKPLSSMLVQQVDPMTSHHGRGGEIA